MSLTKIIGGIASLIMLACAGMYGYSMLVVDGVVKSLNVEGPGKFEVSDAATLLAQAKAQKA